jgi:hypothetical protein
MFKEFSDTSVYSRVDLLFDQIDPIDSELPCQHTSAIEILLTNIAWFLKGSKRVVEKLIEFSILAMITVLTFCALLITSVEFQNRAIREWLYPAPTDRVFDVVRDQQRDDFIFKPAPEGSTLPASS